MIRIFPSLISADLLDLRTVIHNLEPYCDGFHLDVMDNQFVPHLTWGPPFINALAAITTKPLFIHLMVANPESILNDLQVKRDSIISFHLESTLETFDLIKKIRELKLVPSIAISPKTPLDTLLTWTGMVDQVLVMSVEPGSSGQHFLPNSIDRLQQLSAHRQRTNQTFRIAIDGGIMVDNIGEIIAAGAQDIATAQAIFGQKDSQRALQELYAAVASQDHSS